MVGCFGIGSWQRSRGCRGGVVMVSDWGGWLERSSGRRGGGTCSDGSHDGERWSEMWEYGRERAGWRWRSPAGLTYEDAEPRGRVALGGSPLEMRSV